MGTAVQVRADPSTAAALLADLLQPWEQAAAGAALPVEAPSVTVPLLAPDNFERAASQFSTDVTLAALKHHAGEKLLLHAGGIARADGAVAAIIGPSGRGKTTTIRNLAKHFGYVSDETIAIAGDGTVLPYRKPLSVITEGHQDKLQLAPADLGLQPLPEAALRIAALVVLERREQGELDSLVEPLPLAQALVEIVPQTSYLTELQHPLRSLAEIAESTGGIRRLRVGRPEKIVEAADALFSPGECEPWRQLLPHDVSSARGEESQNPFMPAETVVDAIECLDGTLVLTSDRDLRLLTGVGPLIWRGLCSGDDWPALEARVRGEIGEPPSETLTEALETSCEELVSVGVLGKR